MSLILSSIRKQQAGETHLYNLDAEFLPGLNVLAGPTKAGKTSLLRIIAGLDKADGTITLNGKDLTHVPVRKRGVAIVYQQYINYPNFTVYDNIASPLRLAKFSNEEIDKKVREAAELLDITDYLTRLPSELSGGQQQRTAIARALIKDADVILFDEPLVNLDYKLREQLRREMRAIFAEFNKIAIYATTEPLEAALLGDHLVVLDKGEVVQAGPAQDLFQSPSNLRVAEILSDPRINTLPVVLKNGTASYSDLINVNVKSQNKSNGDFVLAIRPHHVHLQSEQSLNNNAVVFQATVTLAEVSGSETLIHVQLGQEHWIVQQRGVHQYQLGDSIDLVFNAENVLLFNSDGNRTEPANEQRRVS